MHYCCLCHSVAYIMRHSKALERIMVDSSSLSNVLCENKASYFAGSVQSTAADAEVPSRPFSAGAKVYPFGTFHGGVDSKNYLHFSCVTPLQQKNICFPIAYNSRRQEQPQINKTMFSKHIFR